MELISPEAKKNLISDYRVHLLLKTCSYNVLHTVSIIIIAQLRDNFLTRNRACTQTTLRSQTSRKSDLELLRTKLRAELRYLKKSLSIKPAKKLQIGDQLDTWSPVFDSPAKVGPST